MLKCWIIGWFAIQLHDQPKWWRRFDYKCHFSSISPFSIAFQFDLATPPSPPYRALTSSRNLLLSSNPETLIFMWAGLRKADIKSNAEMDGGNVAEVKTPKVSNLIKSWRKICVRLLKTPTKKKRTVYQMQIQWHKHPHNGIRLPFIRHSPNAIVRPFRPIERHILISRPEQYSEFENFVFGLNALHCMWTVENRLKHGPFENATHCLSLQCVYLFGLLCMYAHRNGMCVLRPPHIYTTKWYGLGNGFPFRLEQSIFGEFRQTTKIVRTINSSLMACIQIIEEKNCVGPMRWVFVWWISVISLVGPKREGEKEKVIEREHVSSMCVYVCGRKFG